MTLHDSGPADFVAAYEAALATQDWEQVAPLIHDDCVAVFTEDTFRGKAEVEAAFRKTFALIQDETYHISDVHVIRQTADLVVLSYDFAWSGIIDGQPAAGGGRGTSVLVMEDGRWLLLYEHLGPPARGG